jgi:nitroimidazol reductase NimA-like FMN-containing flavoprotein (pyridoxamine 5'-phosphate oxidase superfamily)
LYSQALKIDQLKEIFKTQKLATLATQEEDTPYVSLMAFAFSEDLTYLLVATKRSTRKYLNMIQRPGVSLLIDNRFNQINVFQDTLAVTCIGKAEPLEGSQKGPFWELFLRRQPELESLVQSPDCALMKITIDYYYILSRFEQVEELKMT